MDTVAVAVIVAISIPVSIFVNKALVKWYFELSEFRRLAEENNRLLKRIADRLDPAPEQPSIIVDPNNERSVNDPEALKEIMDRRNGQ